MKKGQNEKRQLEIKRNNKGDDKRQEEKGREDRVRKEETRWARHEEKRLDQARRRDGMMQEEIKQIDKRSVEQWEEKFHIFDMF